jgi:transposase
MPVKVVPATYLMGTTLDTKAKSGNRKGKPNSSVEFKRRLAIAACEPGVSVSKLALAHQVNANMVFKWRRDFRAGLFDIAPLGPATLVPVTLAPETARQATTAPVQPISHRAGMIEINIGDALIRVRGDVDAALLKTVIQSIRA